MSKTLERRQRDASHRDLTRNRVLLLQEQRCPLQPVAVDRRALVLYKPFGCRAVCRLVAGGLIVFNPPGGMSNVDFAKCGCTRCGNHIEYHSI